MSVDIIARGLAASLVDDSGKIAADKMPVLSTVPEGTVFYPLGQLQDGSLIAGKTAEEILLMMLYGIVNPTFTDPKLSVSLSVDNEQLIIGRASTIKGTLTFDRGKIDPAFGTSGYRAGVVTSYSLNDEEIITSANQYDFEIELTPESLNTTLECIVNYKEGEQPFNSIGVEFDAPLGAGFIKQVLEIGAAYAFYDENGEELDFTWFKDEVGQGYLSTFASESGGARQTFAISKHVSVVGIKAYDELSQAWQWLGGSATESLTHFDAEEVEGSFFGEDEDYILYTHNQPAKGERELRIYVM